MVNINISDSDNTDSDADAYDDSSCEEDINNDSTPKMKDIKSDSMDSGAPQTSSIQNHLNLLQMTTLICKAVEPNQLIIICNGGNI